MATIKTTGAGSGLRVLTKTADGVHRVSCSCCESGEYCCVFPGSCGKGPASIFFYGDTLNETSAGSLVYGDGENGAELSDGQWIIYRNGQSRTQQCIGLGQSFGSAPPSVQAILASSYALDTTEPTFSTTLSYEGIQSSGPLIIAGAGGQCRWGGFGGGQSGLSDEGVALIFNSVTCRWEVHNGPLNAGGLFAYLDNALQQSPVGSYVTQDGIGTLEIT